MAKISACLLYTSFAGRLAKKPRFPANPDALALPGSCFSAFCLFLPGRKPVCGTVPVSYTHLSWVKIWNTYISPARLWRHVHAGRPVSYTHLDVYKRQTFVSICLILSTRFVFKRNLFYFRECHIRQVNIEFYCMG